VDLDTPEGKAYYELIKTNKKLRGRILFPGDTQNAAHVFKVVDREADAKDALSGFEKTNELMNEIFGMNDTELAMFGVLFGLSGSSNSIKNELLKRISHSKDGAKDVERKLKSEDRPYVEVIFYHIEKNKNNDTGLRRVDGNIYKFNDSTVGEGYEKVVAWLKEPKNEVIFADLKKEAKSNFTEKEKGGAKSGKKG
jgi:hypothetical protein